MDNTINYKLKKPTPEDWYNIQDHNDNMDIVDAELKKLNDGKAPSGHGLGGKTADVSNTSILEMFKNGCGFYTIANATDTPYINGEWLSVLQLARQHPGADNVTGGQLAFYDFSPNNPKMWLRATVQNIPGKWVEMLHTGNISKYANARIATGTYVGANAKNKTLTGIPFKADMIFIFGSHETNYNDSEWKMLVLNGVNKTIPLWETTAQRSDVTWTGNVPTWSNTIATNSTAYQCAMNHAEYTYSWIAVGKGEGA